MNATQPTDQLPRVLGPWMAVALVIGTIIGSGVFKEQVHAILRPARGVDGNVLSFWALQGITITVIAVLAIVNARGTRLGGGLQIIITTVKVTSLILIAMLPFLVVGLTSEPRA